MAECTLGPIFPLCCSLVIAIVRLVEQEIRGEFLVLVTRKVGLNNEITLEAQAAKAFNCLTLLFSNADGLSTRWQRRVFIGVLGEQLQELFRVIGDQLSKLRIASADLLEDRFKHLRLLLHNLSQLLELGVVAQEV